MKLYVSCCKPIKSSVLLHGILMHVLLHCRNMTQCQHLAICDLLPVTLVLLVSARRNIPGENTFINTFTQGM